MPLYLKPGLRAAIHLRVDENENPRPTFYAKALSMEQQIELSHCIDAMHADLGEKSTEELFASALDLLQKYVDDWKNLPDDFTLMKLSYSEVRELLHKILAGGSLDYEEKKD